MIIGDSLLFNKNIDCLVFYVSRTQTDYSLYLIAKFVYK